MIANRLEINNKRLLSLSFLGSFQVTLDHEPMTNFGYDKVRALLVYLAVEAAFPQPRELLISLFWAEQTDTVARKSLNQALYMLRKALGDKKTTAESYILADRNTVQMNPKARVWLDVTKFERLLQPSANHEDEILHCQKAATLYRGDFLKGFSLSDSLVFDEWVALNRERLHILAVEAYHKLIENCTQYGKWQQGLLYARRLEGMEPWREEVQRQLMILLAQTGQRSAALRQYEKCQAILLKEFGAAVSPETKSVSQQIKLRANFSLNNLPLPTTPFIGRQKELASLQGWLAETAVRHITITGSGGMGKSRLSLAAARHFLHPTGLRPLEPFKDGIYFIDLVPLQDANHIEIAIGEVLHVQLQSGDGRSHRQQLHKYLSKKKILLILDNFEHLLSGANVVTEMLQAAPFLKILITSRRRLHLRSEKVLPLNGLTFQHAAMNTTKDKQFDHDAAKLFVATAEQLKPALTYNDADRIFVNQICQMVGGMPLALELAALWSDTLSVEAIASEINMGIGILETEASDIPARHRSIQAVFDTSWRRLPANGKIALMELSVFQGSFTLEAASTVTSISNKTLALLVAHSLLQFDPKNGRYQFHELLRQFAATHLTGTPELEQSARQKHLSYYCQLAEKGEKHLRGGKQIKWMQQFNLEKGNMQAAFDWGLEHDLEQVAQLAINHALYWFYSGQTQIGQQRYELLIHRKSDLSQINYGWVLTWYVAMIWVQGDLEKTETLAMEAQQLFQKTDDAAGLVMSHFHLSIAATIKGEFDKGLKKIDKAIQIARSSDISSTYFLSACLQAKISLLVEMGDGESAQAIALDALTLDEERGDTISSLYTLNSMANIAINRNDLNTAKELCNKCLAFAQDLNERRMEASQYRDLGEISLKEGNIGLGIEQLEIAIVIGENINNADILVEATRTLGNAYLKNKSYDAAMDAYKRCAVLSQQLNNVVRMASCLENMAEVRWLQQPGNLESVRWLAAATTWREKENRPHVSTDYMHINQLLETITAQLSEGDFDMAWQMGATQLVQTCITEALNL